MENQQFVKDEVAQSSISDVDFDDLSPRKIQHLYECSTDDESESVAPSLSSYDDREVIDDRGWKEVGQRLAASFVMDVIDEEEEDFDINALHDVNARFANVFANFLEEEDECTFVCSGA